MKKLKRSRGNRLIFGVCGGIAEYFNIDATIVRVAWFLLALPSFGTLGLAYLVCGFIIPEDDGFIHPDDQKNYNTMNEKSPLLIGLGLIVVGAHNDWMQIENMESTVSLYHRIYLYLSLLAKA